MIEIKDRELFFTFFLFLTACDATIPIEKKTAIVHNCINLKSANKVVIQDGRTWLVYDEKLDTKKLDPFCHP